MEVARGDRREFSQGETTIHAPNEGRGFRVWPSPRATAWAVKQYNNFGGGWKGASKTAAMLPAKWFKSQKDSLKAILATPLKNNPEYWGWKFREEVLPFFDKFQQEFNEIVTLDTAQDSIKNRIEMAKSYVDGVASKLPESSGYVNFKDPKSYLRWYAIQAVYDKMKEQATTIGDLFKSSWFIDLGVVDKLVEATFKKATPEERSSLTDDDNYRVKYDFLARIAFQKTALRALKRTKLDWDPTKWVDRIYEMLAANYSEQAIQENGGFREFDLHGMKVVVDDRTLDPDDIKKYVRFLNEAYAKLKSKGFEKAWYGNVFIQCKDCGGANPNTGGGTGGWYEIGRDTVTIFNRPGSFIVELMAHELGHRYWFKQMSSAQRAKFEALVKTHTKPRPAKPLDVRLFKDQDVDASKKQVLRAQDRAEQRLTRVTNYDLANLTPLARDGVGKDGWAFGEDIIDAVSSLSVDKDLGSEVSSLKDDVYKTKAKLTEHFEDFSLTRPEGKDGWLSEARQLIDQLVSEALIFIDFATQKHNERAKEKLKSDPATLEWMESFEKNPAPVAPVSTYGASNIDEAFAEVFSHYVMEYEITRDQVESFRSVLKTATSFKRASFLDPDWTMLERMHLGAMLTTKKGSVDDESMVRLAQRGLVQFQFTDHLSNRVWDLTRKGAVVVTAGLGDELDNRMKALLTQFDPGKAKELGDWVDNHFRVNSPKTPKGGKELKDRMQRLVWVLKHRVDSSSDPEASAKARDEVAKDWEIVKPQLAQLVSGFSDEGGKVVPKELSLGGRVYINEVGFNEATLEKFAKRLDTLFDSVKGWRAKALAGTMKVVLASPRAFNGTASGKYRASEDAMYVRATPSILKRAEGYAGFDYIMIHELGHRYEYKVRVQQDFDRSAWYTTRYSRKEGEAFAELFALGHFGLTGTWDTGILKRFEEVMV